METKAIEIGDRVRYVGLTISGQPLGSVGIVAGTFTDRHGRTLLEVPVWEGVAPFAGSYRYWPSELEVVS